MTKYFVVAGRLKQFEYDGPFDDLDDAYAHGAGATTGRSATFKAMACIYASARAAKVLYLMRSLLRSCRCQAIRSRTSTPEWCASCVTAPAGDERREARNAPLFLPSGG
jgi:hypothetical protein